MPSLEKKLNSLDQEVADIKMIDMDILHIKHFIERDLPILTHMQLCEGLNIVQGHFLPELKEFEVRKLKELNAYVERFRGQQCDVGDFSKRIRLYS